jgi:hypothetical protein
MAALRHALGSSVHVPVESGGQKLLVSYWSKEKNAFPPAAVEFLKNVSKQIGGQ